MQNLEQIRARNALKLGPVSGDKGGEVIKKVAPLILNHGLLATAAYSFTEKEGWQKVFDAIAQHLADPDVAIAPGCDDREKLMKFLTDPKATSETLKLATAEAMAWLTYARRFVKKA
jgi:CRISPR-associated protein (Cas_Cmr5)